MPTAMSRARRMRATARLASIASIASMIVMAAAIVARADDIRAMVIGGGPDPKNNQVAIESNVRYLLRVLPPDASRTVLFADGDPKSQTVLFEGQERELPTADRVLALILDGRSAAHPVSLKFRAPQLSQLDGPAKHAEVAAAFDRLAQQSASRNPVLLYFTGHGSPAQDGNLDNNSYDLWGRGGLSVRELAAHVAKLPPDQAVTLVMVQCFSGAFGNLLFERGDPMGTPIDRDIAGFFATVKERMAAGCTPAVDESEYHDFTSYFFAALTGHDRVGRPVRGADFNHDGVVTMDEAFCYALIHDTSIDIPVCTSDVFVRRSVPKPDEEIFQNSYSRVLRWATPAQSAALEELSHILKLSGDNRARLAYDRFQGGGAAGPRVDPLTSARRRFSRAHDEARRSLLDRWPELAEEDSPGYAKAHAEALQMIGRQVRQGQFREILAAEDALDAAEDADYKQELDDALLTRFVRLFKTVVLTHIVRTGDDAALRQHLERLLMAENRPLFAPSARVALRVSRAGN